MNDIIINEVTALDEFDQFVSKWVPYFNALCNIGISEEISIILSIILSALTVLIAIKLTPILFKGLFNAILKLIEIISNKIFSNK